LVVLVIGNGTVQQGVFSTIQWGSAPHFLKVELDVTGGTNFVDMGTTQLLSVPYALYAQTINENNICNLFHYFYADRDSDGFGDAYNVVFSCSPPTGYVIDNSDCNDNNASVHPGVQELCNGIDDNCNGQIDEGLPLHVYYKDLDGDGYGQYNDSILICYLTPPVGYSLLADDCDDTNPNIHPNAVESCNGVDDNCNGQIDEENATGCATYFYDADGDGYGISNNSKCLCSPSAPYTATQPGDCNDTNANIHPNAVESCNGVDDNCNGQIDEENATGCTTYFYDADGDGYGISNNSKCLCSPSAPYTATQPGDCNDTNANINPDAVESCNGVDDNCNGQIDEEDAIGCAIYFYDADGDGYGISNNSKCLCSPSAPYTATQPGDCNDTNANINPPAVELCNGIDDNCDGHIDEGCI